MGYLKPFYINADRQEESKLAWPDLTNIETRLLFPVGKLSLRRQSTDLLNFLPPILTLPWFSLLSRA